MKATIYVEPVPKGRPRVATKGGRTFIYTPQKTVHAESMIREALLRYGTFDKDIPLKLTAIFFRQRPKSLPKRVTMPVAKPDLSNYLKTLEDAMEKFVYQSDSQITTMAARKRFGAPPRIELTLEEDIE
ncbi:hypothetical protein ES703_79262 [subsurface metagenome]